MDELGRIQKGEHLSQKTEFKNGLIPWNKGFKKDLKSRILPRINILENGCWLWQGGCSSNGYGAICIDRKQISVHRVSYELFKGKIPHGLTIDHLCKNKKCINPDHLEPVTQGVNTLRGDNLAAKNARKTHCQKGHEFSEENTYHNPSNGQRVCRICHKIYKIEWDRKKKAESIHGIA